MSSAKYRQVGGSHYAQVFQHWDYVAANGLGYFEAQITRYVGRWKHKNGIQDLQKADHYFEKIIELVEDGVVSCRKNPSSLAVSHRVLVLAYDLGEEESEIIRMVSLWEDTLHLKQAHKVLKKLIQSCEQNQ